jgi:hypothetical protein
MIRNAALLVILCLTTLTSGCALVAPRYSSSLENVQKLKDSGMQPAKVGNFTSTPDKGNANPISIRGSSLNSPYDGSYAKYLGQALEQELSLAGKLSPDAQMEFSGALQKNDMSVPPVGSASGDLAARFVITRGGQTRYDQVKSIHDEWDSSFVGAIAIPRAQERYPIMVQKLLSELFTDPAFLQAVK